MAGEDLEGQMHAEKALLASFRAAAAGGRAEEAGRCAVLDSGQVWMGRVLGGYLGMRTEEV